MLEKLRSDGFEALRRVAARAKRRVARNRFSTRIERSRTWRRLLRKAAVQGIDAGSLNRVYDYLSVISKVRRPNYVDPQQRPTYYFPGLTAKPFHDPSQFDWIARLEDEFQVVREEALSIYSSAAMKHHHQNLTDQGRWDTHYLYAGIA